MAHRVSHLAFRASCALLACVPAPAGRAGEITSYTGICEVSAAAPIGDKHFVVASDETNDLYVYERGNPEARVIPGIIDFDKSDIEGAARSGDRIYWISSQSLNSDGEDKKKRRVFFATNVSGAEDMATMQLIGEPYEDLREHLPGASASMRPLINIEGLAATERGTLMIGFRSPTLSDFRHPSDGRALVIELLNPDEVLAGTAETRFGPYLALNLGGRGIRSIDRLEKAPGGYLIVAGLESDSEDFALYAWAGPAMDEHGNIAQPEKLDVAIDAHFRPEALLQDPVTGKITLLSDDGDGIDGTTTKCSDDEEEGLPPEERRFRALSVTLP